METKMTGYPSIDRPWMKYYSEEAKNAKVPENTIYEYLWENNKDHLNENAIVYFGNKITYRKLFQNIGRLAITFAEERIGVGDIVVVIAPSIPEIIYSFYAINKIGAVSSFLDLRKSSDEIAEALSDMEVKVCIILDDMWDKYFEVIKKHTHLMISVSVSESLPKTLKVLMSVKKKIKVSSEVVALSELKKKYENLAKDVRASYCSNQLALLEYTGGTTGVSKGVMLSNENVNSVVEQTKYSGITLNRGESWLAVAFPFTAYALICSQHLPLCLGITTVLCFSLDVKKVEKELLKYKCNHMANTPLMWEQLMNSKRLKKMDLSFLISPSVMLGYYNNDVAKQQVLQRHSDGQVWMHSGDLGHIDEDGFLYLDGRIKRMIIDSTGFKIFPSLIERVILENADVEKCCVVGVEDNEHNVGQIPVAYIIAKNMTQTEKLEKELEEICRQQLPEYSYPKRMLFIEEFPYTSAAKIDYRKLGRMIGSE